ncbi:MAG TPA: carboxypeptidase-like regulatory domain-containing protein [Terracidiphilus sp.]|nr:carboxypeptidase-like regulatory domain-containing protein [Terracidiphilus sp.]
MAVCLAPSTPSWSQPESQGPIHIWRLHGLLVNPEGKPLSNIEVTLSHNGAIADKTTTDSSGSFAFDHVYGHYRLHVARSNYSQLDREVVVGIETVDLARKMLYVIAGPGACTDDCSSVFTSKKQFDRTLRERAQHHY